MRMRSHSSGPEMWLFEASSSSVYHVREQRKLEQDCVYVQARLNPRCSPM